MECTEEPLPAGEYKESGNVYACQDGHAWDYDAKECMAQVPDNVVLVVNMGEPAITFQIVVQE